MAPAPHDDATSTAESPQHHHPRARRARVGEIPDLLALRHAVFCVEQGVPEELERDADDEAATHLVVGDGDTIIGTCRLVGDGATVRLGRMAVARERRGEGLGALLLHHAHEVAREGGAGEVVLHAQIAVRGFYERVGYIAEGDVFQDAGIAHVVMRRPLAPAG